jgi:5'-nucleotidase
MSLVTGRAMTDQGTGDPIWQTPMHYGADLIRELMQIGWPEAVMLNINFPNCQPDAVKGIRATVQGQRKAEMFRVIDRVDAR